MGDGRDKVFMGGTGDVSGFTSLSNPEDPQYHQFIADSLAMYGAVRRASGAHFDENQRMCHHHDCPHFEPNFCNAYPRVPDSFETCGFPTRIERLINLSRSKNADT